MSIYSGLQVLKYLVFICIEEEGTDASFDDIQVLTAVVKLHNVKLLVDCGLLGYDAM
jgi:hypothetical protein